MAIREDIDTTGSSEHLHLLDALLLWVSHRRRLSAIATALGPACDRHLPSAADPGSPSGGSPAVESRHVPQPALQAGQSLHRQSTGPEAAEQLAVHT